MAAVVRAEACGTVSPGGSQVFINLLDLPQLSSEAQPTPSSRFRLWPAAISAVFAAALKACGPHAARRYLG